MNGHQKTGRSSLLTNRISNIKTLSDMVHFKQIDQIRKEIYFLLQEEKNNSFRIQIKVPLNDKN